MNHTLDKNNIDNNKNINYYFKIYLITRTVNSLIVGLASAIPLANKGNIFVFNKSAFSRSET